MADPAIQSINQHTQKTSLDWLFNILVQPSTGTGSGVAPAVHEQYSLSLDLLRQALVEVGNVVNNITTDIPGKVLDARQGNALRILINSVAAGVLWQDQVTAVTNAPPASPSDGDRYIVGTAPTGAWAGHAGDVAVYETDTWVFSTPADRWGVFVYDDPQFLLYHEGSWTVLADLDRITEILHEAETARDAILENAGFIAVSTDLLGSDHIGTVANDLLLGASSLVKKVADSIANVNSVGNSIANVNSVAAALLVISAVNNNKTNINAVATNEADIDVVAADLNLGVASKIKIVAEDKANIDAVAANKTNINTVAGINADITTLAGISDDVEVLAILSVEIQALADRAAKIDALHDKIAEMDALYGRTAEIDALYARVSKIDALNARTTEIDALYAELGQIAVKENTANKKTTLVENSDTYFPTQKAVNLGLNRTMAEMMGFAPRNLMDVFGTLTVPATFKALRDYLTASGGCDFSLLRLGDYIDLDSFTVNNWYNGAAYDSATGAWDTTVVVTKNASYQNTRVEIVGFDDYRYVGNAAYPSAHHVTFMWKNCLGGGDKSLRAPMHKLNTSPYYQTSQNYKGSDLKVYGLANLYTALADNFGVNTANETLPYQVDRILGTVNDWEWCGAERLFLPTGMNIFGHPGFAQEHHGVGTQSHFPLYTLNPNKRMKRYTYLMNR